jgi:hypothetical protein
VMGGAARRHSLLGFCCCNMLWEKKKIYLNRLFLVYDQI